MDENLINVLLVDKDEQDLLVTRNLLANSRRRRFRVDCCGRLDCALAHLSAGGVDVVLLNNTLPDSNGWNTFEAIHRRAPNVPIIFLERETDADQGSEAIRRGAQGHLPKGTIDQDQLERAIQYGIERQRMEEKLRRYQERLQDLVDDATRDLLTANDRLRGEIRERALVEERLREAVARLEAHGESKNQFVSNVSHELRTPLASMMHALENLQMGVRGHLDERVREYVSMMQEDCRRLMGTITDILDLNRMEANRLVLDRRLLHLGRFTESALEGLKLQVARRQHRLEFVANGAPTFVSCDPQKLDRVIHNLVGNAVKFTPDGGLVEVHVRRVEQDGGAILLEVIDNGVGISPENLAHVTERYFRVGEHVTGSGLGLSLSRDVVELHGGRLDLMSPPPGRAQGTQVTVRFPAASSPRTLVVDDDCLIRELLQRQLARCGYVPQCVATGQEALKILAVELPHILIVDLLLPGMSGFELIAQVKAEHAWRHLPILVITGQDLDDSQLAFLSGVEVAVLSKPWTSGALTRQLEALSIGPQRAG